MGRCVSRVANNLPLAGNALYLIQMRIVVDYGGISPLGRPGPAASADSGREDVLVVHVGGQGSSDKPVRSQQGPLRTRPEALDRDREVRGHENSHLSTLGPYAASGILYDTVTGANGETIAVGGRIAVDLAEVPGDPEATIRKARTVLNAAQAPGDPSAADMRVAARAYQLMQQAQSELRVNQSV